jgi:hypothetical protein
MTSSFTFTDTASFTVTHARHMAAKVAADLKRMQRLYGAPSDLSIADFEAELIELMKASYLGTVTFGFRRDGAWIVPTLRYTAQDLSGAAANDDDPGRIRPAPTSRARASIPTLPTARAGIVSHSTSKPRSSVPCPSSAAERPSPG